MKHLLTINGLDGPLGRVFGCDCGRCREPVRRAHTSASLITLDDQGDTIFHLLFDVGLGVTESLFANPHLAGDNARLDWLSLTHWHPDHTAGINQLIVSQKGNALRRNQPYTPVPLWCRSGTARWLHKHHDYVLSLCQMYESGEMEPPGTLLPALPLPIAGVRVTPVTLSHHNGDKVPGNGRQPAWCCCGFVIETAVCKTVLLWDLDSQNEWLIAPRSDVQAAAVARLSGADYLLIDTAFWAAKPHPTSHPSFTNVQRYAAALQPKQTFLLHLSGHPDGRGQPGWGWGNERWQTEAQQVWQAASLPGTVLVPEIGTCLSLC